MRLKTPAFLLGLVGLLLLGGAIRAWVADLTFPVKTLGDELYYVGTAKNIALGKGHVSVRGARAAWPPAHSYLLSLLISPDLPKAGPRNPRLLRPLVLLQLALGTALVGLTVLLGHMDIVTQHDEKFSELNFYRLASLQLIAALKNACS